MTIGDRIKAKRIECDITQYDLAAKAGVTQVALWSFETDNKVPSLLTANLLAKALGVTLDWLVNG